MDFNTELRKYIRSKTHEYKSTKLLPLMYPSFEEDEILEAFDSMVNLQVTMGPKVRKFEEMFSNYLGVKYSSMVNSGSSANLLALSVLSNPVLPNPIRPGDEIIVPTVTWSTSIFPIINIGAVPVLVDVGEDYQLDIEKVKEAISPKTRAIMPVHLLGNVCDMDAISDIAKDKKLFVVEDCCEAMGSKYHGKMVGSFGDFSSFSTYFSHHITTAEGGFLCTNDTNLADLSRILRAHGYVRDSLRKDEYIKKHPNIDPRFLFVNSGYNFRATDIQASFGLHQLKRLEGFIEKRTTIARKLLLVLNKYSNYLQLPKEKPNTRHSWFVFPILVLPNASFTKEQLTQYLESNGIETRPVVCGNFADQPAMKLFEYKKGDLSQADLIMKNAFYIGIHPHIDDQTLVKICEIFDSFMANK